ncbi:MAG: hypothetical protein ACOX5Z_05020 [Desulfobulbus sp.]|jgi:hypothetical protein
MSRLFFFRKASGTLAAALLIFAAIALVDSLIEGVQGWRRPVDLTPGMRYKISGPMPPKTETLEGFVIDGQPEDGTLSIVPETVYTGYWLGGAMWRGAILVDPDVQPGNYTLSIRDRFGEKQNPALVFRIRVWPDKKSLDKNSPSFIKRITGIDHFIVALVCVAFGLIAGVINFLLNDRWIKEINRNNCFEISELRKLDGHTLVGVEPDSGFNVHNVHRYSASIHRQTGLFLGKATVDSVFAKKILLKVDGDIDIRADDIVKFEDNNKYIG